MKRLIFYSSFFLYVLFSFVSCSSSVNNSVTFYNLTDGDIYINFRGSLITVPSGKTSIVKEIPKGTYDYATTFSVPAGTTSTGTQGNLAGTLKLKAGTKILFFYSSTLTNGAYTVFVTISNSDDQSSTTSPTGP